MQLDILSGLRALQLKIACERRLRPLQKRSATQSRSRRRRDWDRDLPAQPCYVARSAGRRVRAEVSEAVV